MTYRTLPDRQVDMDSIQKALVHSIDADAIGIIIKMKENAPEGYLNMFREYVNACFPQLKDKILITAGVDYDIIQIRSRHPHLFEESL